MHSSYMTYTPFLLALAYSPVSTPDMLKGVLLPLPSGAVLNMSATCE